MTKRLSLLAAEAAAKGVPREQFLEACQEAAAAVPSISTLM